MKNIGKIILIVLGVALIALGAKTFMDIPAQKAALEAAVYLDEPVVLPENEGKLVIVHGKVEMTQPVYDEELGLTLDTIHAYRYDEEYASTYNEDNEPVYQWRSKGTKSLVGKAGIGEFELDARVLYLFPTESYYKDFDPEEIRKYGTSMSKNAVRTYVLVDAYNYYAETTSLRHGREKEGDKASYYRYHDTSVYDEITTIVAIQQGNTLTAPEGMTALVKEGILSQEELLKKQTGLGVVILVLFIAAGLVPLFFGVRGLMTPQRQKNSKKRKKR